jgi:hypothetical protein
MSVPITKSRPMSRLSLSAISNLLLLSEIQTSRCESFAVIYLQLPIRLKWNMWPPTGRVPAPPTNRSPKKGSFTQEKWNEFYGEFFDANLAEQLVFHLI